MVAAALAPLAGGDAALYQSLSVVLALLAGLLCIAGSFLKLGVLADSLSRPILIGFLHGIALSILLGQLGSFAALMLSAHFLTQLPAALVTVIGAALAVKLFGLDAQGVTTVGVVPAGLPPIRFPSIPPGSILRLVADAPGLALVSFSSMMITARSFASNARTATSIGSSQRSERPTSPRHSSGLRGETRASSQRL